jgi:hypothetical protein
VGEGGEAQPKPGEGAAITNEAVIVRYHLSA